MGSVQITDNSAQFLSALESARTRALEAVGGMAESYAKGLVAPRGPKGGAMRSDITAQLRNSITHQVSDDEVAVGSNLDMAAYVELGTGNKYTPSAAWIESNVKKGPNSGLAKWFFYDEEQGRVRIGLPMAPTPFLRPAIENHTAEFERVIESELKNG